MYGKRRRSTFKNRKTYGKARRAFKGSFRRKFRRRTGYNGGLNVFRRKMNQVAEKKYKTTHTYINTAGIVSSTSAWIRLIWSSFPAQGDDVHSFIGAHFFARYLRLNVSGYFIKSASDPVVTKLRICIVKNKQGLPNYHDYFDQTLYNDPSDCFNCPPLPTNPPIVIDKIVNIPSANNYSVGQTVFFKKLIVIKVMKDYQVLGNGMLNHADYYLGIVSPTAAAPQLTISVSWKMTYTDV